MAANSKIEWTDHTFNPWSGCTKVAAGCANCYAEQNYSVKIRGVKWGPTGTRVAKAASGWKEPLKWQRDAVAAGVRARVFCASLADVFEDWDGPILDGKGERLCRCPSCDRTVAYCSECPGCWRKQANWPWLTMDDLRRDLFALIDETPQLDWILLTKRPENIAKMWTCPNPQHAGGDCSRTCCRHRPNVWLVTSLAEQRDADKNVPELLRCRDLAPVLGLSCEPLVGPIDLGLSSATCGCCPRWPSRWIRLPRDVKSDFHPFNAAIIAPAGVYRAESNQHGALSVIACGRELGVKPAEFECLGGLDWVIVGGESGPGARPMHPAWAVDVHDQCAVAGVPFFFKQWGEWHPELLAGNGARCVVMPDGEVLKAGRMLERPTEAAEIMFRVGKQAAGRELDGRTHDAYPRSCEARGASRNRPVTNNQRLAPSNSRLPP